MKNSTVNITTYEESFQPCELDLRLQMCVHTINVLFGFPAHSYIIWLIITGTKSGITSGFFNMNFSVCEICLNSLFLLCFYSLSVFFCVERYLAVIRPVTFMKLKPLRYRAICCSAAWIICLGSCLCNLIKYSFYILSQQYISILYSLLVVLACFIQPLFYLHWAGKLCCLCSKENL